MSDNRSPNKQDKRSHPQTRNLPPAQTTVTGVVCKILKSANQTTYAVLLSFSLDIAGERKALKGKLPLAEIAGTAELTTGIADEAAQARLESIKLGDELTVMIKGSRFGRWGLILVDLSEKAALALAQEQLAGIRLEGRVYAREAATLYLKLARGLSGRLALNDLAGACKLGQFRSIQAGLTMTVEVLGVVPHPQNVGRFYLQLREVAAEAVSA